MEKIKWVLNQMPKNEDKNLAVMALDNVNQARKFPAVYHHPACEAGRYG